MTITFRIPSIRRFEAAPAPIGGLLAGSIQMLVTAAVNRRAVRGMEEMPDHLLKDVGLTRDDLHSALAGDWREDPSLSLTLAAARRRHRRA